MQWLLFCDDVLVSLLMVCGGGAVLLPSGEVAVCPNAEEVVVFHCQPRENSTDMTWRVREQTILLPTSRMNPEQEVGVRRDVIPGVSFVLFSGVPPLSSNLTVNTAIFPLTPLTVSCEPPADTATLVQAGMRARATIIVNCQEYTILQGCLGHLSP